MDDQRNQLARVAHVAIGPRSQPARWTHPAAPTETPFTRGAPLPPGERLAAAGTHFPDTVPAAVPIREPAGRR